MATYDLVIRGGTIVDGTGAARFAGDVAIVDDKIVAVGVVDGEGREEIDATGCIVTPGWVDIHTHFDGQITWDPYLTPTAQHGVTTIVMGNCGVGFAPAKVEERDWVINLMEGVEDIPGAALTEGITWEWETFPEYMDALEGKPRVVDFAVQVPHGALRVYVMGQRGVRNEPATDEDIQAMARLAREGIEAGALGFSTSRTLLHKCADGEIMPGTFAAEEELFGIARELDQARECVFQMTSNHTDMPDEFKWMEVMARETDLKISFNLVQVDEAPELWKEMIAKAEAARAEGLDITPQVAGRPVGVLMNWQLTAHPFLGHVEYMSLAHLPFEERLAQLRDPEVRARILAEAPMDLGDFGNMITRSFHKMFPLGDNPNYEPSPEESVAAIAARQGKRPVEVAYDLLLERDGQAMFYFPLFNYSNTDLEHMHALLSHPDSRVGLGDGGAHCGAICDASIPTFMLTHWTRDRTRGPKLSLEQAVRKQTWETADLYGFHDRGALKAGYRADVNIIDYDNLKIRAPYVAFDLPAGGRRILQHADGYRYTIAGGQVTFVDGEPTGALPGKLVRYRQSAPA